jgi:hypothetical protein
MSGYLIQRIAENPAIDRERYVKRILLAWGKV